MSLQALDLDSLFFEMLEKTEYSKRTKQMLLSVFKNIQDKLPEVLDAPEQKRREKLIEIIVNAGYSWGTVGKVLPFFTRFFSSVSLSSHPNTPRSFSNSMRSVR